MVSRSKDPCLHRADRLTGAGLRETVWNRQKLIITTSRRCNHSCVGAFPKGRQCPKPVKLGNTLVWGGASLSKWCLSQDLKCIFTRKLGKFQGKAPLCSDALTPNYHFQSADLVPGSLIITVCASAHLDITSTLWKGNDCLVHFTDEERRTWRGSIVGARSPICPISRIWVQLYLQCLHS